MRSKTTQLGRKFTSLKLTGLRQCAVH